MQPSQTWTTALLCFALNQKAVIRGYQVFIRIVCRAVVTTLGRLIEGNCEGIIDGYVLPGSSSIQIVAQRTDVQFCWLEKQFRGTQAQQFKLVRTLFQQKCQWHPHNPKIVSGYLLDGVYIDSIIIIVCQVFPGDVGLGEFKELVPVRTVHVLVF